jgi:hypothetical protein
MNCTKPMIKKKKKRKDEQNATTSTATNQSVYFVLNLFTFYNTSLYRPKYILSGNYLVKTYRSVSAFN